MKNEITILPELICITPEIAKEMLSHNIGNRPIREETLVKKYADDMRNGRFNNCQQTISFDKEGNLIDGQHRLLAIIKSGVPTEFYVARNVPTETLVDVGARRTTRDNFVLRNMVDNAELATDSVISLIKRYLRIKDNIKLNSIGDGSIAEFANRYESELLHIIDISNKGKSHARMSKCGPRTALFAAYITGENRNKIDCFANLVNTGDIYDPSENGARILAEYLNKSKTGGEKSINSQVLVTEHCLKNFVMGNIRKKAFTPEKLEHIYFN